MSEINESVYFVLALAIFAVVYYFFLGPGKKANNEDQNKEVKTIASKPIVTITANHVLVDDDLNINEGTHMALEILAKRACIFVFVIVKDKEESIHCKQVLSEKLAGLVDPNHILPCQTPMGCASMARQLESTAHFDYNPEAIHQASIFIPSILIAPPTVESPHARWSNPSFENFMTNPNTEFFSILPK